MKAMILSAGLGTRFRPVTDKLAKPAVPFLNVPLMGFPLFYLEQLGLRDLVINTHHLPKTVQSVAECLTYKKSYSTHFCHEDGTILGSGGGISNARKLLYGDDFVVVNGDEVMFFPDDRGFKKMLEFHRDNKALATLLTTDHPEAGKTLGGVWTGPNNKITRLGEKGSGAKHFAGVFIFCTGIFDYLPRKGPSHIFKDALLPAIAKGEKVLGFHEKEMLWLDTSSEREYVLSTRRALEQLRDETPYATSLQKILSRFGQHMERTGENQWLGKNARCLGQVDSDTLLFMGENSEIGEMSEIKGFAVLGANARFDTGFIESSAVAPNVHVHEMVALRRQVVV